MTSRKAPLAAAILTATLGIAGCSGTGSSSSAPESAQRNAIELSVLGSWQSEGDVFDQSAAEIVAHDPANQRLFVVNANKKTLDVLDIRDPSAIKRVRTIDATREGGAANSVAVHGDLVAVAIEARNKQGEGKVVFYSASNLEKLSEVSAGALPDMVTFTPDGKYVLVANEGEPDDAYEVDPEGSVSVIDVSRGVEKATVRTADFSAWSGKEAELRAQGIRVFGPGATAAQDFEPEYIAVSTDGSRAWVALQENNAVAVLDIARAEIVDLIPLGFKDHMAAGNELDASNKDGGIHLRNWPVMGMYMPDAITSYGANGQTWYITANEGDARDYDGFSEEARVADLRLADGVFPSDIQEKANLGRLKVTTTLGISNDCDPSDPSTDVAADCEYDALYSYGARSFSIWSEDGEQVYDSGSDFERITAQVEPEYFNSSNDENAFDDRSDDKGPEPEAVVTGEVHGQVYAFIGLERVGGIMVFNVTDPRTPAFVQYLNNRDFSASSEALKAGGGGDLGPEGLAFIAAQDSPTGEPMLAVGNEVSGTTTLYSIDLAPAVK
ncbi:choice-of-anchor I family protein [Marinobacter bryozoorum]|uniref:choice-of-anchor I family protein n=1 Tax=Marinobacter bryozoorum TaxID=256324 RepID=UPI0020052544|nr:choice-of-anchor I family protein [Marinobacter bryozoorum]MCK7545930.1 choice-of-anchor I family protein [Marinobacter bryozoorum]